MLDHYFVQICYLVDVTRNAYGDRIQGTTTELPCRFREISTTRRETNREVVDADAMLWVGVDSGVANKSVVLFDGIYYQVERITKARRLGESEVQFIKCDLKVIDIALS